ncbi:MAG TPA: serine/threonine-protein kinase [Chitinivibrionales bacterium]|nr:serine/threonine-protein kinase [Chitinivibrionales bacterium]
MNEQSEPNQPAKRYIRPTQGPAVNPYQSPMPKVDDKIGPNRIVKLVGEGGMANVYKVWHEGLEVTRALKILKNASDKELRERFFTEAKILADIHHPNIVEIHNLGYWEQQVPFLEMEFVDGLSIRDLITTHGRFPLPVALITAYFVCQSLHYAHFKDYTLYGKVYKGLIHRDIKPDNIIISKDGMVKLMDFGIARPSEVSLHTIGGKVMGSLAYLSPEQLEGRDIDHRSDIFSLGSVLYEMITGQRAYPQKTISELVRQKSRGEFAPISSFNLGVPKSVEDVVKKSMALSRDDRFGTAAEMANALYREFKMITDRAPADVVFDFIKNPAARGPDIEVAPRAKKEAWSTPVLVAVTAGGAVLLLALLFFAARFFHLLP